MPTLAKILTLTTTITSLLMACSPSTELLASSEAADELTNRNWLDVWPESKDDRLNVFRFTPSMGGGVFQERNVFEGTFELFTFQITDDHLRLVFPGRGEQHTTHFQIERVDGPAPFTRRLTFQESARGPAVYYGYDEKQVASPFEIGAPR